MNYSARNLLRWAAIVVVMLTAIVSMTESNRPAFGAINSTRVADIKRRGELVIGIEASFPPYEYIEAGKIIGFDADLAQLMARALGVKVKLIDVPLSGAIPALLAGKYDTLISGITITPERAKRVAFSVPYGEATAAFLVLASSPFKTPKDLVGKRIAVQLGGAGETQALSWSEELKKQYGSGFGEILRFQTSPETHLAVQAGRADASIASLPSLSPIVTKNPGKFRVVPGLGNRAFFGIAVRKQDNELRQFYNKQIRTLKQNGQLAALQKKWLGFVSEIPDELPDFAK